MEATTQFNSKAFWTETPEALCSALSCTHDGLTSQEAAARLKRVGPNSDAPARRASLPQALGRRLLEPLSLILIVAGIVSIATGDAVGGTIIVAILGISIGLDTLQERHALKAAEMLRRSVALKAEVRRDGAYRQIAVEEVVPGDLVRVRVGDIVPADALILECSALTVGEAALTGEPYPVEKRIGVVSALNAGEAVNALFRGSIAQTGEAVALVVGTGRSTLFGSAASVLGQNSVQSPFQRDLRDFGVLTARMAIALVLVVMTAHLFFGRPILQSLLFSAALAVGLTPELLPMITTVTLTRGAMRMAKRKVIVKRLASIHDLGAMTIFCTDKTGTLTSAEIVLAESTAPDGTQDPRAAMLGAVAADLGGDRGAMDAALIAGTKGASTGWALLSRRAFDFTRRLGSVLANGPDGPVLIAKGAPEALLPLCTTSRSGAPLDQAGRAIVLARIAALAAQGLRAVAIASKPWAGAPHDIGNDDESGLSFEGLCAFADPPKPTAAAAIARLAASGIELKILSGDDPLVVKVSPALSA